MTQTGKTACMLATIYEYLQQSSCDKNILDPKNIFILTGLSSTEWCEQTEERFPSPLKSNIYHRNKFKKLRKRLDDMGDNKRDILILLDEIHIANKDSMTMGKFLNDIGLKSWKNLQKLNINFVKFSATPNQILEDVKQWKKYSKIHTMKPGIGYRGIKEMIGENRLFQANPLYIDDKDAIKIKPAIDAINEIKNKISSVYGNNDPRFHIIRINTGDKSTVVMNRFEDIFGNDNFEFESCTCAKNDNKILDIIQNKPTKHTFLFIKELLRCAITLKPKSNVGILYERIPSQIYDDVIIQGLVGRATGYDVHDKLIVYSNIDSVNRYIEAYDDGFKNKMYIYRGSQSNNPAPTVICPSTYTDSGVKNTGKVIDKNKDFEWLIFSDDTAAQKKLSELKGSNASKCSGIAPKTLLQEGNNPTIDYVIKRKYGLNGKSKARQVRLNTGEICVFWRPSLIT
jgi:hypothetical protein